MSKDSRIVKAEALIEVVPDFPKPGINFKYACLHSYSFSICVFFSKKFKRCRQLLFADYFIWVVVYTPVNTVLSHFEIPVGYSDIFRHTHVECRLGSFFGVQNLTFH